MTDQLAQGLDRYQSIDPRLAPNNAPIQQSNQTNQNALNGTSPPPGMQTQAEFLRKYAPTFKTFTYDNKLGSDDSKLSDSQILSKYQGAEFAPGKANLKYDDLNANDIYKQNIGGAPIYGKRDPREDAVQIGTMPYQQSVNADWVEDPRAAGWLAQNKDLITHAALASGAILGASALFGSGVGATAGAAESAGTSAGTGTSLSVPELQTANYGLTSAATPEAAGMGGGTGLTGTLASNTGYGLETAGIGPGMTGALNSATGYGIASGTAPGLTANAVDGSVLTGSAGNGLSDYLTKKLGEKLAGKLGQSLMPQQQQPEQQDLSSSYGGTNDQQGLPAYQFSSQAGAPIASQNRYNKFIPSGTNLATGLDRLQQ